MSNVIPLRRPEPDPDAAGFVARICDDFAAGCTLQSCESACLWTLADILEESVHWTDEQRRIAAAVLQREVLTRVKEER